MEPIYLDHAATTPMREEVREAMLPYLANAFGNPSSLHRWGREAADALAGARATAADALGADPGEIYFTRGGTESDNLAVVGRCRALRAAGGAPTLALSAVEHHAVHDAAAALERHQEAEVWRVAVSPDGALDWPSLERALRAGTSVASFMWVNNETGMVLPVPEIAERVAAAGGTLHTDGVQAVGKVPVSLRDAPIDLLTITGHKIYGPKGTGVLFVRAGTELAPLLHGGGQERALRPGTEDVAGAVGLAVALRLAVEEREHETERLGALREALENGLKAEVGALRINAGGAPRAPHVSSVGFPGLGGEALLAALDLEGLAVSGGSACASGSAAASHVLAALYGADDDHATVRLSLGRDTRAEHVRHAIRVVTGVVGRMRALGGCA